MKLVRFMSENELQKYMRGERLENRTDWRKAGWDSGSKGFCFFDDSEPPEKRLEYVCGIVDTSLVAVFEPVGEVGELGIVESIGIYRDPVKDMPSLDDILMMRVDNVAKMQVKEYSTRCYNSQVLRLVRYGRPERSTQKWRINWQE